MRIMVAKSERCAIDHEIRVAKYALRLLVQCGIDHPTPDADAREQRACPRWRSREDADAGGAQLGQSQ